MLERTKSEITESIISYFEENETVFNEAIEELDSCDGCLGEDRYYNMDELDELFYDTKPTELLYRAFYGHDADSTHKDYRGEDVPDEFNPNREYFYLNGYGNFVSTDYKDYSDKLDKWLIEDMAEHRADIYAIDEDDELKRLFDEYEEAVENGIF